MYTFIIALLLLNHARGGNTGPGNDRVVGGTDARPNQFPHQVSLQYRNSNYHFCGGSVIRPHFVVTAAHCLDTKVATMYQVRAGTIHVAAGGVVLNATAQFLHPDFRRATLQSDIALVQLAGRLTYGESIRPIALPIMIHSDPLPVTLTGWGYTSLESISLPDILQTLDLATTNLTHCQTFMTHWPVGECQVCTLAPEGQGACNGDSGGPLIWKNTLIGVVSFGFPCALGKPDVFCGVRCYVPWILEVISTVGTLDLGNNVMSPITE